MDLACVETQIGDGDTADCEVIEFSEGVGVEILITVDGGQA
jgi:hypothetical protein